MLRPNILDVVQAVTTVAPSHPRVKVWWYAPEPDQQWRGDRSARRALEIVVECEALAQAEFDKIGADLSSQLRDSPVTVREHRGRQEEKRLFRMLTAT